MTSKLPVAFAGLLAVLLLAPATALAAEETPPTSAQCRQLFETCEADCRAKHPDDQVKRGACLPVCSARYAACDARAAFERARPWLEDKAKKTKEFLDELMEEPPAEEKAPEPDTDVPSTTKT